MAGNGGGSSGSSGGGGSMGGPLMRRSDKPPKLPPRGDAPYPHDIPKVIDILVQFNGCNKNID